MSSVYFYFNFNGLFDTAALNGKRLHSNHFWAKGYCVDTVGLDAEMIRKYVKYQEAIERRSEQVDLF